MLNDLNGASLQPSSSSASIHFALTITLPTSVLMACKELSRITSDYILLYMMEWIINPYIRSNSTFKNSTLGTHIVNFASLSSASDLDVNDSAVTTSLDQSYTLRMQ